VRKAVPRLAVAAAVLTGVAALASASTLRPRDHPGCRPAGGGATDVQRGFALPSYSADGYRSPRVTDDLCQMVRLGADWIELTPTWYQASAGASAIAARTRTPSDGSLADAIDAAHRAGLKVFLKPLLDVDSGDYRGTIRPADRPAWFASYTVFINHYAELAARHRADEFGLGTELAGLSSDRAGWLSVVAAVRARYWGTILYAANFDEYRDVRFWDAVDQVGIDAYWPVSTRPTDDAGAVQRSWAPIVRELARFTARTGQRILFTEAGYTSQRGSTTAPWSWTTSGVPAPAEQACAYQALLASLSGQAWWSGVFWWAWDVPDVAGSAGPLDYSPHGKPAAAVLRRWWN
jgi:hypothetical protein